MDKSTDPVKRGPGRARKPFRKLKPTKVIKKGKPEKVIKHKRRTKALKQGKGEEVF